MAAKQPILRAANPLPVQNYPLTRTPTPVVPPLARPRFFLFFDNNNFGFLLYSFHHHIHLHLHIHLHIHVEIVDVRCHSLHTFGRTPLNFRYFSHSFLQFIKYCSCVLLAMMIQCLPLSLFLISFIFIFRNLYFYTWYYFSNHNINIFYTVLYKNTIFGTETFQIFVKASRIHCSNRICA